MKKKLKLIAINILVFATLLMVVEFFSMLIIDSFVLTSTIKEKFEIDQGKDLNRWKLDNYENFRWAKKHFEEFEKSKSSYKSFYGWRRDMFSGKTINVDSLGIRKTFNEKLENSNKVLFLGGSTMFGEGSDDNNTIPSHFSIKTKGKYKVINLGESAYTVYQSFIFLQTLTNQKTIKNIDLIITYDGVNNILYNRNFFSHEREQQIQRAVDGIDSKQQFVFMSYTRKIIEKLKSKSKWKKTNKYDYLNKKAAIELLESWLLLKKKAKLMNADFICILQPVSYIGKPNLSNLGNSLNYSRKEYFEYYNDVNRLIHENEKYKVLIDNFIDMTKSFDNIPNIYIDFCHVSPQGNKIIASKIVDFMKTKHDNNVN